MLYCHRMRYDGTPSSRSLFREIYHYHYDNTTRRKGNGIGVFRKLPAYVNKKAKTQSCTVGAMMQMQGFSWCLELQYTYIIHTDDALLRLRKSI